jgi:tetratricopeptide (TPR) repeat protein
MKIFNRKKFLVIFIVLILVIGTGFFIWFDFKGIKRDNSDFSGGNDNIPAKDIISKEDIPDLSRPIIITADLSEDAKQMARKNIEDSITELKMDYTLFNSWMKLGVLRKMIGDYEGAKEAWEFAGMLAPKNAVSFNNLGELYWHYFFDFQKAENNFLRAIRNDPKKVFIYINLSELYRFSYKEKFDQADDILLAGLDNNPGNLNLLKTLANYYSDTDNKNEARKYYDIILELYPEEDWARKELQNL